MTIKDIVTSTSPSLSRSFTGDLDLADEPVAVSVVFADGSVRLLLGEDTVGAWPLSEVQFVPAESGYELVAEGDSLSFVPHDRDAFASFVLGEPREEPAPSSAPIADRPVADSGGDPAPESEVRPAGLQADDQPGFYAGLEPEFAALEKSPTSLLDLDDEPDEFFAAGLNGPPSEGAAPAFRSPLFEAEPPGDDAGPGDTATPPKESTATPENTEVQDEPAGPEEDDEPTPSFGVGPYEGDTPAVNGHGNPWSNEPVNGYGSEPETHTAERSGVAPEPHEATVESTLPATHAVDLPATHAVDLPATHAVDLPATHARDDLASGPARDLPLEPAREPDDQLTTRPYEEPEWADDQSDLPVSRVPEPTPSTDYPEYAPDDPEAVDPDATDVPEAEDAATGGFLGRFRARASRPKDPDVQEQEQELRVDSGASLTEDDTPQSTDDAQNLRQWGLVAAGGLVISVVAVMVIWGLASILGGDGEPVEQGAPATTVVTAPPETAPPPEATTPTVPTSASPENIAAAQAFVSDWNSLASQYANQLSISADSLPISVAPEPTIHLNYEEDGILSLSMAPRGNGNDRDILLAMGLAIAWADPDVSPEGRKSLLAELGVDVDDPVLTDMGGEVSRSGITYRATVDEAILTFQVDPTG